MNPRDIQNELASVLKDFRTRDYESLSSSLERVKDDLVNRCETEHEREFVSLAYHVTALTLADLKRLPLDLMAPIVNAAFAQASADPALLVTAIAGYAGRCRAEGRDDLGRGPLRRAVEVMDAGDHWRRLIPDAQNAIRGQLEAMED